MQAVGLPRKAAISFLSNISLDDAASSKKDRDSQEQDYERAKRTNLGWATIESSDPQLDIPPDPDLESSNRIRSTSLSASSFNPVHKPLISKRDKVAAMFLSNITIASPVLPEAQLLSKSPSEPTMITSELMGSLSLPRRASTVPDGLRRKSQAGFNNEQNELSSSSSDSSSDDEQQFYRGTGSYTDEDTQLSTSKKSSYLIDLSAPRESTATQAMTVSPVFAKVRHHLAHSNQIQKTSSRRSRLGKYVKILPNF